MTSPLLEVRGLRTVFHDLAGAWPAVDGVDLVVHRGECGPVGESGSGKSVTGFSLVQLIDAPGEIVAGEVLFKGEDLRRAPEERLRASSGRPHRDDLPGSADDPQSGPHHRRADGRGHPGAPPVQPARPWQRRRAPCRAVGISSPEARLKQYPHEFSGGMRQRVAIATALLNKPDLIIADEPTTALDVTIQSQILFEVQKLSRETGTAVLWITHDLAVVAELADRVAVMYAGRIVETGTVDDVLDRPRHPYTLGLLGSSATMVAPGERLKQINGSGPQHRRAPERMPVPCRAASAPCPYAPRSIPCRRSRALAQSYRCHNPVPEGHAL